MDGRGSRRRAGQDTPRVSTPEPVRGFAIVKGRLPVEGPLKILFVTSEADPLASTGGLGEVSNALPISYLIHPEGHIAWMQKASIHKELLIELFKKVPKPEQSEEPAE